MLERRVGGLILPIQATIDLCESLRLPGVVCGLTCRFMSNIKALNRKGIKAFAKGRKEHPASCSTFEANVGRRLAPQTGR